MPELSAPGHQTTNNQSIYFNLKVTFEFDHEANTNTSMQVQDVPWRQFDQYFVICKNVTNTSISTM